MSNKNRRNIKTRTKRAVQTTRTSQRINATSNSKKTPARGKLNYKKLISSIIILFLIIFLISFGAKRLLKKDDNQPQPTSAPVVEEPQDITISMVAIGDIMSHESNFKDAYDAETKTYDFSYVFEDIKDYIQSADIAIGNLETTFAGAKAKYSGYPTFNTPEQLAQNLVDLGLDVVSTANNHSLDKKYAGIESTIDELDKVNLSHTGTYKSAEDQNTIITKNVNGINIAFLSFTYGTNGISVPKGKEYCINLIDEELILDQIEKAKALNPDLICVSMHWGEEYKLKQNKTQEKLADLLFQNGVDIILGSHPHVLEPMEKRTITLEDGTTKDGFLIYSLGNFMSGQVIENTMNTIILQLQITKHVKDGTISIDSVKYVPIYMYNRGDNKPKKYKILDIDKMIEKYESGDSSVSEKLYKTLVNAKKKIDSVVGMEN